MRIKSLLNSSSFSHEWMCFWFYRFVIFILLLSHHPPFHWPAACFTDGGRQEWNHYLQTEKSEDYKKKTVCMKRCGRREGENEITYICGWCKTNVKSHRIISNTIPLDWQGGSFKANHSWAWITATTSTKPTKHKLWNEKKTFPLKLHSSNTITNWKQWISHSERGWWREKKTAVAIYIYSITFLILLSLTMINNTTNVVFSFSLISTIQ